MKLVEYIAEFTAVIVRSGVVISINKGDEEFYEITTLPEDFSAVREYLENKGITYLEAEIKMVPQNYMSLVDESAKKMGLIIEKMEDLDDVQEIWHNWDEEV